MTGGMSTRTCYTKLNFDFPYVRSLSLRRDTNNEPILHNSDLDIDYYLEPEVRCFHVVDIVDSVLVVHWLTCWTVMRRTGFDHRPNQINLIFN